jgi:hypothetical protein
MASARCLFGKQFFAQLDKPLPLFFRADNYSGLLRVHGYIHL